MPTAVVNRPVDITVEAPGEAQLYPVAVIRLGATTVAERWPLLQGTVYRTSFVPTAPGTYTVTVTFYRDANHTVRARQEVVATEISVIASG